MQGSPVGLRLIPKLAFGCKGCALHVVQGYIIHSDQTRPCPGLNGHVAQGHTTLHGQAPDGGTRKFNGAARATGGTNLTDNGEGDILGSHTLGEVTVHGHPEVLHFALYQAARGKDVLHFRGANAVGQCPHGAVGRGVGIPTDNGHARQCRALLRPHDVDNALANIIQGNFRNGVGRAVVVQGLQLDAGYIIFHPRQTLGTLVRFCRDVVVRHGDVGADPPGLPTRQPQALEGLGGRHLMEQLPVDIDQRSAVVTGLDQVAAPQFVVKGLAHFYLRNASARESTCTQ